MTKNMLNNMDFNSFPSSTTRVEIATSNTAAWDEYFVEVMNVVAKHVFAFHLKNQNRTRSEEFSGFLKGLSVV